MSKALNKYYKPSLSGDPPSSVSSRLNLYTGLAVFVLNILPPTSKDVARKFMNPKKSIKKRKNSKEKLGPSPLNFSI